jgi:sensor histidine kinase YesM
MILEKIEHFIKLSIWKQFVFWLLLACTHFVILKQLGNPLSYSLKDSIIFFNLILFSALLLKQIVIFFNSKVVLTPFTFTLLVVFSIAQLYLHQEIGLFIGPNKSAYINFFGQHNSIRIVFNFLILFIILYQLWIEKYKEYQTKYTQELIEIERQLNRSELLNIQQQLKPHFIFNSLNSINALIHIEPAEAQRMVQLLSDFLRGTIRKDSDSFSELREEIHYMNLYLEIEKVRFGDRLQLHTNIEEQSLDAKVPLFILQPILENSIKYGLYDHIGQLTIRVDIKTTHKQLTISITNPYHESSYQGMKGMGFGLESIERKLELLFKQPNLLQIEKTETLYTTKVIIPQIQITHNEI